ncbi:SigE family RNA polymerase sigma factor [Sphaerisporangium aureirubrum]|uniref:SigE family RNA polymerase sigma factor n=1 Tax=Sphaerisporangium aureirubrum TaxID=1544736 RepID=A0ABW1NMM5_9ACTN
MIVDVANERRFREFVASRSPALMRLGYLLTGGDQHAAEDLLQTVLIRTAARWTRIDDPEPYVRRAMYRQQVSWWRLAARRRETVVPEAPDIPARDDMNAAELKLVLRHALARLTARQRAALVLRFFADLPEGEVAQVMGCSVGTVRSTVHRSLARLRVLAPELAELDAPRRPPFKEVTS